MAKSPITRAILGKITIIAFRPNMTKNGSEGKGSNCLSQPIFPNINQSNFALTLKDSEREREYQELKEKNTELETKLNDIVSYIEYLKEKGTI